MRRQRAVGGLVACSVLALLLLVTVTNAFGSTSVARTAPMLVPTTTCSCEQGPQAGGSSSLYQLQRHGPPNMENYDEQLGITFSQSFTSIEYNVTAVEQTDPQLDTGPAYLLNGLANNGYWYQVGVSWNWGPGSTPGTGFDMNYEVFDTQGDSIYPRNGGGLSGFSGPVNEGDTITLNLYIGNSSDVVMVAEDTNTGAFASQTYSSFGATYFAGLPSAVASSNGYFTGLMNEWYHGAPYYANGEQVIFSNPTFALSSAWMWMDEFNANTIQSLFTANTASPVTYTNPNSLQEFSYNGTVEYSDAYEFITGNATVSTTNSTVPLTLSYAVLGGGTTYSSPVLTYVSGGSQKTATLSISSATYQADIGSTWTVTGTLGGSSSSERWQTDQPTTGVAKSADTVVLEYYHQFSVSFEFAVSGGGSAYSEPTVAYDSFGSAQSAGGTSAQFPLGSVWADSGSRYNYTDPLPGSSSSERWNADPATGTVDSSGTATVDYYHQFLVTVDASFEGSVIFPSVSLRSTSEGRSLTGTVAQGANTFWLDASAQYSISQTVSLLQGERWATNATTTGVVSGQFTIPLAYQYQYYVGISTSGTNGGTTSAEIGWYLPGTNLQVTATPNSGWQFEGWTGVGAGSTTSSSPELSLTLIGPANETAAFYPGVTVTASGPVAVSYQDGTISGRVAAGTSSVVYVPASSTMSLSAGSAPLFYSFTGWSGAVSSKGSSVSLSVDAPESVMAGSSYDYASIAIVSLAAILIVVVALLALTRSRKPKVENREETVGSPAA